ncbi:MAG: hypothetical protein M3273_03665 [Actinomycetota bacterium]|nr:hypothetical protein [Actinomycetota bacterium]
MDRRCDRGEEGGAAARDYPDRPPSLESLEQPGDDRAQPACVGAALHGAHEGSTGTKVGTAVAVAVRTALGREGSGRARDPAKVVADVSLEEDRPPAEGCSATPRWWTDDALNAPVASANPGPGHVPGA